MSDDPRETLDDAIRAFVASEGGAVTDWVLFTAHIAEDCEGSERWYMTRVREGQTAHSSLGLVTRQTALLTRGLMGESGNG